MQIAAYIGNRIKRKWQIVVENRGQVCDERKKNACG